jgi:hypothetical protein
MLKQYCSRLRTNLFNENLDKVKAMKIRSLVARAALAGTMVLAGWLVSTRGTSLTLAQGAKPAQSNLSSEEQAMLKTIAAAPDPAARLKAVDALIKKHPKTSARERVAREMADQIADVKDAAQKATLAQQYQAIFTEPSEQQMFAPVLIDALAGANRPEDAFAAGSEYLKQNPDSFGVLVQMVSIGTEQAKQKNAKFIPQSLAYATHAIELAEADKKPDDMDVEAWKKYKATGLPSLYQSMGLMNLVKGDRAEAKVRLAKAAALAPADAFNYVLLTGILNDEYQDAAKHYQGMPNGAARDEELKKVLSTLDSVIDGYAHAVALSEGSERLAGVRKQYLEDLEAYYKYRHNNSTAGMQELIDKYKVPAKP